jgi:colanic acid biosynthesis protein WcaH
MTGSMDDTRLNNLLTEALREIPAPERGLPDAAFDFALKIVPMVNVDLLVKAGDGRTLLAWREDEYGTGWHIPGGIIRLGEMAQDRIHAVADHELAAEVSAEAQPCFVLEQRGKRGHFVSLLYRCKLISSVRDPRLFGDAARPRHGQIAWIEGVPDALYPDHAPYKDWLR